MEATKSQFGSVAMRVAVVSTLAALMLAAAFLLWPRVSYWHQHRLAISMVEKLELSESPSSRAALRQVAALGNPAIEALMLAAASEHAEIALVAREIVDEELASWKIRSTVEADFSLCEPASLLAGGLANHVKTLGPLGQQWASRLSLELVELAAEMSAAEAVPLLADCSAVMAAVTPLGPRMRTLSSTSHPIEESSLPVPGIRLPHLPSEHAIRANEDLVEPPFPSMADELVTPLDSSQSRDLTQLPRESNWVPEWSRLAPALGDSTTEDQPPPNNTASAATTDPMVKIPSPDEMATLFEKFNQQESPGLLNQLSSADHYTSAVIRAVLKERGIGAEELSLAARLTAADPAERLQLIDDLKVLSARTARRWLRELLTDKDAEVRLKALTAMATTNDPELVGIARDIAVHDSDQRVTELATRIMREAR